MQYRDFEEARDGFTGHLATPDGEHDRAVLIFTGGEKGMLPRIRIAESFADAGICGIAVSLFGAPGLPAGADQIPLEYAENAVSWVRKQGRYKVIAAYGMSMGTIFALLAARYFPEIDKLILCAPTHVAFEGSADKKHMSGHSVATYCGADIPFVPLRLGDYKPGRYYDDERASLPVTGMWRSFRDAYDCKDREAQAALPVEGVRAEVLIAAGTADEAWDSAYSAQYLAERMQKNGKTNYRLRLFPDAGHLIGMMPSKERYPGTYRMMPLIAAMYRRLKDHKEDSLAALDSIQQEMIGFLLA